MLVNLSIKNYAIIQGLEVDFHPHLNIITGETGAGKSIIVGALNMILGKRADSSVLRDKDEKCVIEGTFKLDQPTLVDFFVANDLDFEQTTIIRREIKPDGKSRAFINDTPVNLETLKNLTSKLVDLHEQHETEDLLDPRFYINILDYLAKQTKEVAIFQTDFSNFNKKTKKLKTLQEELAQLQTNKDYIEFQFNELAEIRLNADEDSSLEAELNMLENAEEIQITLAASIQLLEENEEVNLLDIFSELNGKLGSLAKFSSTFESINERINSISIELNDISKEINRISSDLTLDEERLQFLKERQNLINRVMVKHHVFEVSELIALQADLKSQLDSLKFGEDDLENLEKEVKKLQTDLHKRAKELSKNRLNQIPYFKSAIESVLLKIGMPYATINLSHLQLEVNEMNNAGIDQFDLLFSANKGSIPQTLKKVASGGERSRLMLAIKSTIADNIVLPTMIFDEIDTGISGEVAAKVGEVFKSLAKTHQIISITHLPQIAAKADQHLFVYKDHSGEHTNTSIKILDKASQIIEIAKMLSGENPGQAALNTAKELVN